MQAVAAAGASAAAAAGSEAEHAITTAASLGPRLFENVRTLLETRGSFRSFEAWTEVAGCKESRRTCVRAVGAMAAVERTLTHEFIPAESVFRILADGLERTYQVELGTVVWDFP